MLTISIWLIRLWKILFQQVHWCKIAKVWCCQVYNTTIYIIIVIGLLFTLLFHQVNVKEGDECRFNVIVNFITHLPGTRVGGHVDVCGAAFSGALVQLRSSSLLWKYGNCILNFQNYINYINYQTYYKTNDLNLF